MDNFDFSKSDIVNALKNVGLKPGDNIFVHSNIGFFGKLEGGNNKDDYYRIFKDAIFEVIGSEGTLVVPTFTYSYCWNQVYDKHSSKSTCGFFSEMVRNDSSSVRSEDGNFSIAAIGKNALYFVSDSPSDSFGEDSFWGKFLKLEGKFCNWNFDSASTFIHFVEKQLNVDYRYDKTFLGKSLIKGKKVDKKFTHFVYDLEKPENSPDFSQNLIR